MLSFSLDENFNFQFTQLATHSKPSDYSACQVPPSRLQPFRTGRNHTFHRYEHCFFCNCQGLRPKRKVLQNYLLENQIDILALNKKLLEPKFKFHLPGYDIYKNDRLVGTKGGVAMMVKKGIIVNQEWKSEYFNVITEHEALAIETEL